MFPKPVENLSTEELCELLIKINKINRWFLKVDYTSEVDHRRMIFHHNATRDFGHFITKTLVPLVDEIYPYKLESYVGEKYLNVKIKNKK